MKERDHVEALVYSVVEADFLIAAVTLVDWIVQDGQGERRLSGTFDVIRLLEGGVAGGIVDDEDLGIVFGKRRRQPADHLLDGPRRIVSDDKDQQPFP